MKKARDLMDGLEPTMVLRIFFERALTLARTLERYGEGISDEEIKFFAKTFTRELIEGETLCNEHASGLD